MQAYGKKIIKIIVNGRPAEVLVAPNQTLLEVLRNKLKLTGTKYGCGTGECGNCTVLLDGKPILSCLTLAITVDGREITTIEGLAQRADQLHPLQQKFIEYQAFQCGRCTPAMILTAKALLDENPKPSEEDVKKYISGVLCRCTGYVRIIKAIMAAALQNYEGRSF